jgi:hypothetical protein
MRSFIAMLAQRPTTQNWYSGYFVTLIARGGQRSAQIGARVYKAQPIGAHLAKLPVDDRADSLSDRIDVRTSNEFLV